MVDRRREQSEEAREPRTPGNYDDDRDREIGKPGEGGRHFGKGAELEDSRRLDHQRRPPGGDLETDQRIMDELAEAIRDSELDEGQVEIGVEAGVVSLRGALGTEEKKRRATELALNVPGVRDVTNRITISGGAAESP